MKIINCLLFFLCFSMTSYCQHSKTIKNLSTRSYCKSSNEPPNVDLLMLVEFGEDSISSLLDSVIKSESYPQRASVALGILCQSNCEKYIEFIESIITHQPYYAERYIRSIFRIGGETLVQFYDYIFSKSRFETQVKILNYAWLVSDLESLRILHEKLKSIELNHPEYTINKYTSRTFFPRLNLVIRILENENKEAVQKDLEKMIDRKFDFINSGQERPSLFWAMKQYRELFSDRNNISITYLKKLRFRTNLSGYNRTVTEAYLYERYQLGDQLSEEEINFLSKASGSLLGRDFDILFETSDEVMEYFKFLKEMRSDLYLY